MPPLPFATRATSALRLGITVLSGYGLLQSAPSFGEIVIARQAGSPDTTIVLGTGATEVEQFAARELQFYVALLTRGKDGVPGVELPIHSGDASEPGKSGCEILIGTAATHPRLKRIAESQSIDVGQSALGVDGFVIKTVPTGAGFTLLLTGSHERSSLFAVYRLLQLCGNDAPNPWWNWVAGRLLWDSSADVAELHRRFCRAYYGNAAPAMLEYLDSLWKEIASEDISPAGVETFRKLDAKLREAEIAAGSLNDEDIRRRMMAARSFHTSCLARKEKLMTAKE